jgi:catechol 2,3-dioxygenase-like lactoylglutathione lyase family enzyme
VRPLVFSAALLGCLSLVTTVRAESEAGTPQVALKRVNLLVRDMERSLAIYRDILFCLLDSTTEVRALALTQVTGIALPPSPPLQLSAPVIRVQHHQDVQARLEALGLEVVGPRRSRTAEGHDFTEFAFTDPDGHLVVLYELD